MQFEIKSSTKYALFAVGICLALLIVVMQAFQYLPDQNQEERLNTTINVPGDETVEEKTEEAEEADEEQSDNEDSDEDISDEDDANADEFKDAQEIEIEQPKTSETFQQVK